eukprot:CAMPEP_0171802290 /NCGR_PEP_ID=MMETSP0991-20121206/72750_1 /TAXON_ID=483369 /ORGANISM="non described non described, Strain CCMP2098" /LENGTH=457 /DNA_ID=CAMNT_0012414089 /DNA_START=299 /DNA_END=1674 /DNA_ORIENTATION=-
MSSTAPTKAKYYEFCVATAWDNVFPLRVQGGREREMWSMQIKAAIIGKPPPSLDRPDATALYGTHIDRYFTNAPKSAADEQQQQQKQKGCDPRIDIVAMKTRLLPETEAVAVEVTEDEEEGAAKATRKGPASQQHQTSSAGREEPQQRLPMNAATSLGPPLPPTPPGRKEISVTAATSSAAELAAKEKERRRAKRVGRNLLVEWLLNAELGHLTDKVVSDFGIETLAQFGDKDLVSEADLARSPFHLEPGGWETARFLAVQEAAREFTGAAAANANAVSVPPSQEQSEQTRHGAGQQVAEQGGRRRADTAELTVLAAEASLATLALDQKQAEARREAEDASLQEAMAMSLALACGGGEPGDAEKGNDVVTRRVRRLDSLINDPSPSTPEVSGGVGLGDINQGSEPPTRGFRNLDSMMGDHSKGALVVESQKREAGDSKAAISAGASLVKDEDGTFFL